MLHDHGSSVARRAAISEGGCEPREVARRTGEVCVDVMHARTIAVVPQDQRFEEVERTPEHRPCVGTAGPYGIEQRPEEGARRTTERVDHQPRERERADRPDGGGLHASLLVGGRQHLVVGGPLQRHREDVDARIAHRGDLALDERVRHERIAVQHVADACTLQLGIARCGRHGLRIVPVSNPVDFRGVVAHHDRTTLTAPRGDAPRIVTYDHAELPTSRWSSTGRPR